MRLFLGIDLPEDIKKSLSQQILVLRTKHPSFRWVHPENYHITLHFFGEVHNEKEVAKRIEDILYDAESFVLVSLNLDVFVRKDLLLHLTFRRQKKLEEVVKKIYADLDNSSKDYTPHLTLSRSALSSKQQYFALKNEIDKTPVKIEFPVNSIFLFESMLGAGKNGQPVYRKVQEFKLL